MDTLGAGENGPNGVRVIAQVSGPSFNQSHIAPARVRGNPYMTWQPITMAKESGEILGEVRKLLGDLKGDNVNSVLNQLKRLVGEEKGSRVKRPSISQAVEENTRGLNELCKKIEFLIEEQRKAAEEQH